MAGKVNNWLVDQVLLAAKELASDFYLCSQEPMNYTQATATYALGRKQFAPGGVFPGPITPIAIPTARRLITAAIDDGVGIGNGMATRWAIVDRVNLMLLADNDLAVRQPVQIGNIWMIPAFEVGIMSLTII